MKLPRAGRAVVETSKVVDYLLSARHPDGRSKAAFFRAFGFRAERWEMFARALRDHGVNGDVTGTATSDYGTKYSVDGVLWTPDGRKPQVRTVWIVETECAAPRFVTAHRIEEAKCWKNMIASCSRRTFPACA